MFRPVNTVVTSQLNCTINLRDFVRSHARMEYKPSTFSGAIWKSKKIGCTCLLFANGRMVCCGTPTFQQARKAVRQYARLVQKSGYPVHLSPITLQTITLTHTCGYGINLRDFCQMQTDASYEPELFPAAMVRSDRMNFTVFRTGKVIVSGVKSIKAAEDAFMPILLNTALCST